MSRLGLVAIVVDDRLSRQKSALLTRTINAMRQFVEVQLLPGTISEAELVSKIEASTYKLILAPWYRYLVWSKVEAIYGLTRTSGPTFAGYHCEALLPYELGEQADHLRAILLDFGTPNAAEISLLLRSLLVDSRRSGLQPLLRASTPIHCENWFGSQGLGNKIDAVLSLPEIANGSWKKRGNAIRVSLTALWSLIYEEGPGKGDLSETLSARTPRAAFQVAADEGALVLRLCYTMPSWTPKNALSHFWPDPKRPSAPAQLLLKFADFLRVHTVPETDTVEVVAGFLDSAPAEAAHGNIHTLWIEPLAASLMTEVPFELPGQAHPRLRLLPVAASPAPAAAAVESPEAKAARERQLTHTLNALHELKRLLADREEMIKELRSGGVGTAPPPPPPDAEALLDAFQERYFEARFQIRSFELQIADMEKRGATGAQVETLRSKMHALTLREQAWLKKLAQTIQLYREQRAKTPPK